MKRSIGACEKYHGAVIDHAGHENTRVFREVAQLGAELDQLGNQTLGARSDAKTAVLFDWDNWWAISYSSGPSIYLDYCKEVEHYYKALFDLHIPVDIIGVEDDLSKYDLVIAPVLYMVKTGYDEKIRSYVKSGAFVFLLNHREDTYIAALPFAGTDLLSGKSYETGDALILEKKDVAILKLK